MKAEEKNLELLSEILIKDNQLVDKLGNIIVRRDILLKSRARMIVELSEMLMSQMKIAE